MSEPIQLTPEQSRAVDRGRGAVEFRHPDGRPAGRLKREPVQLGGEADRPPEGLVSSRELRDQLSRIEPGLGAEQTSAPTAGIEPSRR